MNLEQIEKLDNDDLIDLFIQKVECDHYDPFDTPKEMQELYNNGVTQRDLRRLIINRMCRGHGVE